MSRPRLALSFLSMAALLALCAQAAVSAFPLTGAAGEAVVPSTPQATRPGVPVGTPPQAQRPPIARSSKAFPYRIHDVRAVPPPGYQPAHDVPWIFEYTLDASGSVAEVTSLSGPESEVRWVIDAIRQWKYTPPPTAPFRMLVGLNLAAGRRDPDQPGVLVGGNVKPPLKIGDVKPVYPPEAREAGVQGVVIIEARIDADGSVAEARILRSVPMLNAAALAAVLQWKYQPRGYPVVMTVTCNFTLSKGVSSGVAGGVAGGVGGGVSGGVGGGVAGGVVDPAVRAQAMENEWAQARAASDAQAWGRAASARDESWARGAIRVGGNVKPPVKLKHVDAVYPAVAEAARVQGVVIVEARIDEEGQVGDARILRSIPLLDQAALEAVKQWEYRPALLNGKAVPVIMALTVSFTLDPLGGVGGGVAGHDPSWAEGYVRVGGNIQPPTKVVDVKPVYPTVAREARVQGVVIVEAKVGPDGRVQDARVIRSIPLLDEAALEAVKQWEFSRTLLNGVPVGVIMTLTVNFVLV